jgi:hypothetical protein
MTQDINSKISALEKELTILKLKKLEFDKQPKEYQVATTLHSMLCRYNHTDGCGWFYREYDWESSEHKDYLYKANILIEFSKTYSVKLENLLDLIELLK